MKQPELKTVIKTLRAQRQTHVERIDQIDLALAALLPLLVQRSVAVAAKPKKKPKPERRPRILPPKRPAPPANVGLAHEAKVTIPNHNVPVPEPRILPMNGEPSARRVAILDFIRKAGVTGLTAGELKSKTASLKPGDRQNALQQLKQLGKIRRSGQSWVLATERSPTDLSEPDIE